VGTAVGVKLAAVGAAALVAAGVGTEVAIHSRAKPAPVHRAPLRAPAAVPVAALQAVSDSSLAAARAVVAEPMVVSSPAAAPAVAARPRKAIHVRPHRERVTPATALPAASAAMIHSISAPASPAHAKPAARQQPQLSGGGRARTKEHGLTVRDSGPAIAPDAAGGPATTVGRGRARPDHPAHPVHPAHPAHPVHPVHPEHPAKPDPPGNGGTEPGGPAAAPPPDSPPTSDPVDPTTTPDVPPAPDPPSNPGPPVDPGPPVEPPAAVKPPKPPKPPNPPNPQDILPPLPK
jgi:hypothetical protein